MIEVAAAIIRNGQGEILICQRREGGYCAHLWEFPGGKLEARETLADCAVRECREELQIEIRVERDYERLVYAYPDRDVALTFFVATIISGTLQNCVHADRRWVKPRVLGQYEFCPANKAVLARLVEDAEKGVI